MVFVCHLASLVGSLNIRLVSGSINHYFDFHCYLQHDDGTPLPQLDSSRPYSASNNMSWKDRLKPTPIVDSSNEQRIGGQTGQWSNVADSNINKIVEKVLQLDDKGQRRLLRALADLDSGYVTSTKDFGEALASPIKPLKATVPVKNMVNFLQNYNF